MQNVIKHHNCITTTSIIGILCTIVAPFVFIFPISSAPNSSFAATGTSTPSSLTFEMSSSSARVGLLVNDASGTFATSSNNEMIKFSITTDNYTGYTVSLVDDGNTVLTNNDIVTNNTLLSITNTSGISSTTFDSASYNGKWGLIPNKYNSVNNSSYLPSPSVINSTNHSIVLDNTTTANPSIANNYTIGLGVRADYTKPSGTYTKTLTLSYVANPIVYNITYDANTQDAVTNMPSNVVNAITDNTSITLENKTPVRTGYTFQGWCLGVVLNDGITCDGTTFQPNGSFGIDQTSNNTSVGLVALWEQNKIYIQDFTKAMCEAQASSKNVTVYDKRDENDYTVRYINGNCWMTQNLRLAKSTSIEPTLSNVAQSYAFTTEITNNTAQSYSDGQIACSDNKEYGCYYNYAAASAGTITGASNNTPDTYNICPKNWTMPSRSQFSGIISYSSALNATLSGIYNIGGYSATLINVGTNSSMWSATAYDTNRRYHLFNNNGVLSVTPDSDNYRRNAFNIRCVRSS